MPFAVEFSAESERDFELIFDHLFESYINFGESTEEALEQAAHRIMGIRKAADRLATFPIRGTARDDVIPGVRYLTIDRAIYWFDVDEAAQKVCILAFFLAARIRSAICWFVCCARMNRVDRICATNTAP